MTESTAHDLQPAAPNAALRSLDVMVGSWELEGRVFDSEDEIRGRLELEWLDGGYYLVQRVDVDYAGERTTGVEYVGYDAENDNLKSSFYSNQGPGPFGGVALDYVWEVGADTLTIWAGSVGSPANFKGTFSDDRTTVSGRWEWPGGGYDATMTKVR
jgi:hypothetical protein